ncbi:MAG: oxidoreductase [Rhodospirillaceae bacterium]|nr:oxidoreductase [Rhodospirillaceae bacterium]|tara:strand:+ start:24727 stop:26694 length:1968 start_codon:yes stop_codon:yes gene_type:complete
MKAFPHLFEPMALRGHTVRNRLFFPAHGTSLGKDGKVADSLIAYHEARAEGGAGMIIVEGMSMHPSFDIRSGYLLAADPEVVPGFRQLSDAVHCHDTVLLGQLFHPGAAMRSTLDGSRRPALSSSAIPFERYSLMPNPASHAEIADLTGGYALAAGHIVEGGMDGVEILASMGYLVAQFLNPRTNIRDDRYGGSLENRMRFLMEILEAARARIGPDPVLGVRISDGDDTPDAMDAGDVLEVCQVLEQRGLVDYINVIGGNTRTARGWIEVVPPMTTPHGHVAGHAAVLKRNLSLPVLVGGRINQPQLAEEIVASGQADMVGTVRAMIADPRFAAKAQAGQPDDIRACIACNQACMGHRLQYFPVSCIQHPETGRETIYSHDKTPAPHRRSVMVVGGGPAGMKAAAVLAERGHYVVLHEQNGQLGGQALLAQALPGRDEFGGIVTNLTREMKRFGVRVERNSTVTVAEISAAAPDAVVVATGGEPYRPEIEGEEDAHVVEAWSVIRGEANVGGSVVIADWKNDWIGVGLAEKLARDGCRVRLAVTGIVPGQNLQDAVRDRANGELSRLGVEVIPYARIFGADSDTVYLQHTVTDEPIICDAVETLVLSQGTQRVSSLANALRDWSGKVHVIGDALSPRTAEEAVLEGLKAGMEIEA